MADKLSLGTIDRAWKAVRPQVAQFYQSLPQDSIERGQNVAFKFLGIVASEMSQVLAEKVKAWVSDIIAGKDETT